MTCNITPSKTDYYIPRKDRKLDYYINPTVVIKQKDLNNLKVIRYHVDQEKIEETTEIYPCVNSYYNHTEDADPLNKVNSLLAQYDILEKSIEDRKQVAISRQDGYTEREAQIRYLESKPVSFIILGKPDIGQKELGRQLSNFWNCVYIEPETLIEEEIESGSRAGECIEFNLRCGRAIGIDVILKLVEKRVKSESSRHTGFVLCGLPVIPNDLYEEDPVSSQSAVFTAKDIFEEIFGSIILDKDVAPSKPQVSVSSKYQSDAEESVPGSEAEQKSPKSEGDKSAKKLPIDIGEEGYIQEVNIGQNYEEQLNFLFNLLEMPYFIIYIQASTIDVINKRDGYRLHPGSNQVVDIQRRSYNRLYQKYLISDIDLDAIEDFFDPDFLDMDDFRLKSLVKLPRDFKASVNSQLDRYHYTALNFVQNRVIAHDQEYYIKVDGRTSITKMLSLIKAKIKTMNLQQVLIPKRLSDSDLNAFFKTEDTLFPEDANSPREEEDMTKITPQEYFTQLKKHQTPSRNFLWSWSEWGSLCPVSMKNGVIIQGNVKFPVQFMNKIFFLVDHDAYLQFYRNPRPFLLPPYPRTNCKIFIYGPRLSGRTALAQCLALYYSGKVLSTVAMMNEFMHQRQNEYLEKIKQQAIAEGIALLNKERKLEAEELEKERIEKIKDWVRAVLSLLEQLNYVLQDIEKEEQKEQFEISSFPMAMKRVQTTDVLEDSEFAVALTKLREELQSLNVPIYKLDTATWKSYFTERKKLLQYLPLELAVKVQPKPATVFDEFVKSYVEEALAKAGFDNLQISGGSILEMFLQHIKNAEENYVAQGFGRGGWIIDGMMCNLDIIKDFGPDYRGNEIIVLKDDKKFLVKQYEERKSTFFRDFRDFFLSIGMQDAAWRSPSLLSTDHYKAGLVQNILDEILESDQFYNNSQDENEETKNLRVEQYKQDISTFEKDWVKVKQFYLDHNIKPIEVNVAEKTMPELFQAVIKAIDDKYRYGAHRLTDEDRSEEMGEKKVENEMFGEDTTVADTKTEDADKTIRKYGDTYHFCPVTFLEDYVLWKGKEKYAVKYNDKVYLLATETDMKKFIIEPLKYLPSSFVETFPPPRICVIGVSRIGKTYLAKQLSENYGCIYISYETFLKHNFNISSSETLDELKNGPVNELASYLIGEKPLPEDIFKGLRKFWFDEPFKSRGFVFDDFPKTHYDINFMVKTKLIPEVILCPEADSKYLKTKFFERHLKLWQDTVNKQRLEIEMKQNKAMEKWKEQRDLRFNILMEEKREQRYVKKIEDKSKDPLDVDSKENDAELKSVTQVTFDSVAEQEDIDEVNKILDFELPPLVFNKPVENSQDYMSKTEPFINRMIETDLNTIKLIKEKCLSEEIKFTETLLNMDDLHKTRNAMYLAVETLKFRKPSFFESHYEVSLDVADRLLSSGYLFLSKFGKTCPIQVFENKFPVQLYGVAEENNDLYALVLRNYVYFLAGTVSKEKFKSNPIKYANREFRFPLIRYKVAVIGPPKCGKTVLVQRIQKEFGFKVISRGQAARYVLKYLPESDLAKNMETVLRKGWELTDEMIIKAVEAAAFDKKAITLGIIFDGFPNTLGETRHLSYIDLVPNIVVDLKANEAKIFECLLYYQPKEGLPKYGRCFIDHVYEEWQPESGDFRTWFDREYQALIKVPVDACRWSVWHQAKSYLFSTFWEIKHYYRHIVDDWPLRLGNMLVTPLEFLERLSTFKSYCPLCLHYQNFLNTGGEPPDRTGLVQYRNFFYWVCSDHVELFLKYPEMHLPPYTNHGMPSNLPKKTYFQDVPSNVYEDGACAVCYKLKRIITKGKLTLSSTYNEKAYLFDSVECLNIFLKSPHSFLFGIDFRTPVYPDLNYQELPVQGMLEQYVAKDLVQGISFIGKRRPIVPGLGVSASALVGLGLFLKVINNMIPAIRKPFWEEGYRLYNERRNKLLTYLNVMKTYRNPFIQYKEPLPEFRLPPASEKSESLTTYVSRIVDKCVDDIDIYLQDPETFESNMDLKGVGD